MVRAHFQSNSQIKANPKQDPSIACLTQSQSQSRSQLKASSVIPLGALVSSSSLFFFYNSGVAPSSPVTSFSQQGTLASSTHPSRHLYLSRYGPIQGRDFNDAQQQSPRGSFTRLDQHQPANVVSPPNYLFCRIWKQISSRTPAKAVSVSTHPNVSDNVTVAMPSQKTSNGPGQVSHRLRNFFRMNTGGSTGSASSDKEKEKEKEKGSAATTPDPSKPRHTKFFSNTVGRLRAHTVASEGNQLEEAMSPTAHANPYFAHQGQPGLRHHNSDSVPPSPPDTPSLKVQGPDGAPANDQTTSETKEELARRLRRVASAPNAQGLFSKNDPNNERPATAELGKDPLLTSSGALGLIETAKALEAEDKAKNANSDDVLAALPAPNLGMAFRRTYSSNSIKVRNVEVSPSSFDKIKLIGKGDVGKVYLVREKKSSRLYAMKSMSITHVDHRDND